MNRTMTPAATTLLVLLRAAIGWHFLYEGMAKLLDPAWSAAPYLKAATGPFAGLFRSLAESSAMPAVDAANGWGLALAGLALMIGILPRAAAAAGAALLLLYYAAHPPFGGHEPGWASEGHYLIVNKNLVELCAILVLAVLPREALPGVGRLIAHLRARRPTPVPPVASPAAGPAPGAPPETAARWDRREWLKGMATLPILGVFTVALAKKQGWISFEEKSLAAAGAADGVSGATLKVFHYPDLKELKAKVPRAKIGNAEFSRVILGGNLIGGWAHARDLIYVSKLVKAYHTPQKVFETLHLAEQCGINAILTNPVLCDIIGEYWKRGIGKIQFISDCGGQDVLEATRRSIDAGAAACYVQGEVADRLAPHGKFDTLQAVLDLTRKNGLPAGLGAHRIETVRACVAAGLKPDFWMKTLHHRNYWSAAPAQEHDNIFDRKPEETIAFMKDLPQPWIAFKTLAAGAIAPNEGFRFAFENGADFICVGMYDFQMVENTNLATDLLASTIKRNRPWCA